jgi:tRNA (cmo5U34)-methyltransferase
MASCLLTGASGYLGRCAFDLLSRLGHRVTMLEKRLEDLPANSIAVDIVVHAAALTLGTRHFPGSAQREPERVHAVNVLGMQRLLAALRGKPRFLFLSSKAVYGGSAGERLDETAPLAPVTDYGRSKATGETLLQQCGLHWMILRPASIFGAAHGKFGSSFINLLADRIWREQPISIANPNYRVEPVHVWDLAALIALLCDSCWHDETILNVGGPEISLGQIRDILFVEAGIHGLTVACEDAPGMFTEPPTLDCARLHRYCPDWQPTAPERVIVELFRARQPAAAKPLPPGGRRSMKIGHDIHFGSNTWSFRDAVETFDAHIASSIPFCLEQRDFIAGLARFFMHDGARIYEIGVSTGRLAEQVLARAKKRELSYVGIDNEAAMVEKARQNLAHDTRFTAVVADAAQFAFEPANLVLSFYTLQFIPLAKRLRLLSSIFVALESGGALILYEKTLATNARIQDVLTQLYFEFKASQGFTSEEILNKAITLQGILDPCTSAQNLSLLRQAGFATVETIYRQHCFEGYLAIKE